MAAGNLPLVIERGVTWSQTWTLLDAAGNPIILTNYTGKMQIRTGQLGYGQGVDQGTSGTLILELSTTAGGGNGKLVLGGAAGTVVPTLSATDTATLPLPPADACYDL